MIVSTSLAKVGQRQATPQHNARSPSSDRAFVRPHPAPPQLTNPANDQNRTTIRPMADQNTPRAFSGIDRLYGNGAYAKLHNASVTIVGIGGVGSWAAEAISRHAIQNINIIAMGQTWAPARRYKLELAPTWSIGAPATRLRASPAVLS